MRRIICIGNKFVSEDAAGPKVYEHLMQTEIPSGIEVIDGGLAGLNLLSLVEGMECVVFVDSVSGFGNPGEVLVLDIQDVVATLGGAYDHAAGLPYLLGVLPHVCEGAIPNIFIVGIEHLWNEATIAKAATLALEPVTKKIRLFGTLRG